MVELSLPSVDTGSACEAVSTVEDQRNIQYVERNCPALITQKKYKEAIKGYKKILEIKPNSVCALYYSWTRENIA
jgi:hypothetical protein